MRAQERFCGPVRGGGSLPYQGGGESAVRAKGEGENG